MAVGRAADSMQVPVAATNCARISVESHNGDSDLRVRVHASMADEEA